MTPEAAEHLDKAREALSKARGLLDVMHYCDEAARAADLVHQKVQPEPSRSSTKVQGNSLSDAYDRRPTGWASGDEILTT